MSCNQKTRRSGNYQKWLTWMGLWDFGCFYWFEFFWLESRLGLCHCTWRTLQRWIRNIAGKSLFLNPLAVHLFFVNRCSGTWFFSAGTSETSGGQGTGTAGPVPAPSDTASRSYGFQWLDYPITVLEDLHWSKACVSWWFADGLGRLFLFSPPSQQQPLRTKTAVQDVYSPSHSMHGIHIFVVKSSWRINRCCKKET